MQRISSRMRNTGGADPNRKVRNIGGKDGIKRGSEPLSRPPLDYSGGGGSGRDAAHPREGIRNGKLKN